jgi:UDP-N-acetylmuramate--alanine ligase
MVGLLLERAGLDPTVLIGGEVHDYGGNARVGQSDLIVAEADESDGSLLEMRPHVIVLTNADWDHLDYYGDWDSVVAVFRDFLGRLQNGGKAIVCGEDPGVQRLLPTLEAPLLRYGVKAGEMDLFAGDIRLDGAGSRFRCVLRGQDLGELRLSVPGLHNVCNALGAVGAALSLDVPFSSIQAALPEFRSVARRFECRGSEAGVTVMDDYAHHPAEVMATLGAASLAFHGRGGRIVCVFQPHRFSRTRGLGALFGAAFSQADEVIVTDVYAAGEKPIDGVSGEIIYRSLLDNGHPRAHYVPSLQQVPPFLLDRVRGGDVVLTLGAGDVWKVGDSLLQELRRR